MSLSHKVPVVILVLLAVLCLSANGEVASGDQETVLARAERVLRERAAELGLRPNLDDLRFISQRESLTGSHLRYQQTVAGVPLFASYVTVSLPRNPDVAPFIVSRYRQGIRTVGASDIGRETALDRAFEVIGSRNGGMRSPPHASLVYYPLGDRHVASWMVLAPAMHPVASWLVILRADSGEVLLKHDLLRTDSGLVFDQNPSKTSGGAIPPPNDCETAPNEVSLQGQYRNRDLANITAGQDKLKGTYADLTAPGISGGYKEAGLATEPSHVFVYPCNNDRFEEVMSYYHVDIAQRKLQSLGFTGASGVVNRAIPIHAHYFADCNAFFDPVDRGLHFGDSSGAGCGSFQTDTAEDADVIVHEYGHAIQDDQIPAYGFGPFPAASEAISMGEGFADFVASAISGDPCLGEWVSFQDTSCSGGTAPGLRWLDNSNVYPADYLACPNIDANGNPADGAESEEPHCGGLVWGGALWDLVQSLGGDQAARDLALQLVVEAHFFLDPLATFNEAASAVCLADNLLYSGAHVATISGVFSARGMATGGCASSDFAYVYLRILHTFAGDLDINLRVGADVGAAICSIVVQNGPIASAGDLAGYFQPSTCASFLPPSVAQPWWLEVQDAAAVDTGTIENFEVALNGGTRCIATDVPVFIPDATSQPGPDAPGPKVYSKIDCSSQAGPPLLGSDLDGDATPDVTDPDDDNDSCLPPSYTVCAGPFGGHFRDAVEFFVGTGQTLRCPATGAANDETDDRWPPDFDDNRVVNVLDVLRFRPHLVSVDGNPLYARRFDLNADNAVNVLDVTIVKPYILAQCSP